MKDEWGGRGQKSDVRGQQQAKRAAGSRKWGRRLVLKSRQQPLSDNDIRPYAISQSPSTGISIVTRRYSW